MPATKWDNLFTRVVLDGWQISGVTIMQSQNRDGFTYAFTGAPTNDLSGNGCTPRVARAATRTCRAASGRSTASSAPSASGPAAGRATRTTSGTSTNDEYHPPGYINHDITFFKNFAIGPAQPAVPRRALQRVQHDAVPGRRQERGVRLRHRPADRHEFRPRHRCPAGHATASSSWGSGSASESRMPTRIADRDTRISRIRRQGALFGAPSCCTACRQWHSLAVSQSSAEPGARFDIALANCDKEVAHESPPLCPLVLLSLAQGSRPPDVPFRIHPIDPRCERNGRCRRRQPRRPARHYLGRVLVPRPRLDEAPLPRARLQQPIHRQLQRSA